MPRQIHGLNASHVAPPTAAAKIRPPHILRVTPATPAAASVLAHVQWNSRRSIATIVVAFAGSPPARVRGTATTHACPAVDTNSCSLHRSQNPDIRPVCKNEFIRCYLAGRFFGAGGAFPGRAIHHTSADEAQSVTRTHDVQKWSNTYVVLCT